jgi:hypothetical protein
MRRRRPQGTNDLDRAQGERPPPPRDQGAQGGQL